MLHKFESFLKNVVTCGNEYKKIELENEIEKPIRTIERAIKVFEIIKIKIDLCSKKLIGKEKPSKLYDLLTKKGEFYKKYDELLTFAEQQRGYRKEDIRKLYRKKYFKLINKCYEKDLTDFRLACAQAAGAILLVDKNILPNNTTKITVSPK